MDSRGKRMGVPVIVPGFLLAELVVPARKNREEYPAGALDVNQFLFDWRIGNSCPSSLYSIKSGCGMVQAGAPLMSRSTIIHFVRHGEVDNPTGVRYGRLPGFHISVNGRLQANELAHHLSRFPIRQIFTSPLERTQQTATCIALAHPTVEIKVNDLLLENKTPTEFEGKTRQKPFVYPSVPTADGETTHEVIDRMLSFCRMVQKDFEGEEVVAVSHGDPIGLLYHYLLFGSLDSPGAYLYPGYCSDWQFVWHGRELRAIISHFTTSAGRLRA